MRVKFKKLHESAVIPTQARQGDAGADLTAVRAKVSWGPEHTSFSVEYWTGLAVEIPEGYVGLTFPRSSISGKDLSLANSVGVIDSGYRGEISFRFKSLGDGFKMYQVGDRVGQLVIIPYLGVDPVECDELSDSERGTGGYGSTGK